MQFSGRPSTSSDSSSSGSRGLGLAGAAAAVASAASHKGALHRGRRAGAAWRAVLSLDPPVCMKIGDAKHLGPPACDQQPLDPKDLKDVCEFSGVTLSRYMVELEKRQVADSDLRSIMTAIAEATTAIAGLIRKAPLRQTELLGLEGDVNVQGEEQKKLDVIANDILKRALSYTGKLGTAASEEEEDPITLTGTSGKYVCVFDPLDGSSNLDAGIPVGTIFGIFRQSEDSDGASCDARALALESTLQPGKDLVAAGYVFYSASTEMVLTFGQGVAGFTLDTEGLDFRLTRPHVRIPSRGSIYSLNQAHSMDWDEPMQQYIADIQQGRGATARCYSQRYLGSMVGDVHRTLLYGGLFAYPATQKHPDGKLRLLYEAAPMSFLVEQAGGKSITGHSRVMDVPPADVHQRVPVILGSPEDVDECYGYYDRCGDPNLLLRCERRLRGIA